MSKRQAVLGRREFLRGGVWAMAAAAGSIPAELVRQVDQSTAQNNFTNSKRTLRETFDGLYQAFRTRLGRLRAYAEKMESS